MQCTYLGGTEQTLYMLMRGLRARGFDFTVCSMHPPGDGAAVLQECGIPVIGHEYRGRFGWRTHRALRRTIGRLDCDLVLVSGPTLSGAVAVRHARRTRRVLTVHYHHGSRPADRLKWGAFYRLFGADYARITFLTDFIRREAEAVAPHLADRFVPIRAPLAVPPARSADRRAELRARWGLSSDAPVVANAGQLIPRKRWDVFLNVAARVARRERDAQFLIAGDGPARPALEARARALGLDGRVRFIGWLRDADAVYGASDVLLFNSDADAFGRTPAEAMACGVPVVASVAYGGTSELIEHGRNGFLLDRHEEGALAEHVCALLRAPGRRAQIVREAMATVQDRYGCEAFLDAYERMFREVLA